MTFDDPKNTNILLVIVIGLLIWILVNLYQNKTHENFGSSNSERDKAERARIEADAARRAAAAYI